MAMEKRKGPIVEQQVQGMLNALKNWQPGSSSKYHQAGGKYLLNLTKELQVNSILASDRTLTRKKPKKGDFLEHQSILQDALAANPCDGSNANGKPPNPITTVYMTHVFQNCSRP